MRKRQVYAALHEQISSTAIVRDESNRSGFLVIGRYCVIAPEENDIWDIWLVLGGNSTPPAPLSTRKLHALAKELKPYWVPGTYIELDGEAHGKVRGPGAILDNRRTLGIRKRRTENAIRLQSTQASNLPVSRCDNGSKSPSCRDLLDGQPE